MAVDRNPLGGPARQHTWKHKKSLRRITVPGVITKHPWMLEHGHAQMHTTQTTETHRTLVAQKDACVKPALVRTLDRTFGTYQCLSAHECPCSALGTHLPPKHYAVASLHSHCTAAEAHADMPDSKVMGVPELWICSPRTAVNTQRRGSRELTGAP